MVNLLRKIRHLPSREDVWIIGGFNALCITLFIISFPRTFALWTLGAFLFFGLICWIKDFSRIITALNDNKVVILAPVIYFILYLIYCIFGDHLWGNVEDKLMFLLVPLLGLPLLISDYLRRNLRMLLLSFLSGLLIICLYQVARAAFESLSFIDNKLIFQPFIKPGVSRFVWDQLSNFEHPSYLAIKIIWAIVLLLFAWNTLKIKLWLTYILIALFSIFVYLLAAKAQLLILIIILIYTLFFRFKTSRSRMILIVLIPLSIFVLFRIVSQNVRVEQKLNQIKEQKAKGTIDWKDFDHRTRSWFSSLVLIKENPILGLALMQEIFFQRNTGKRVTL